MSTLALNQWLNPSEIGYLHWRDAAREQQIEVGEFLTLGRSPDNQIVLTDDYTSQRHARIEKKSNGFLLRDLRSRNGTLVNGTRILEAWLSDGDRVRIGQTDLTFSWRKELTGVTIGSSSKNQKWNDQLQKLPGISASLLPVLLTGPSGTGKEVLAQAIHRLSERRDGPFVSVNCSALTESLVESELFGHIKGSFTGATNDRKGAFEAARAGTLFLDEIGDLPLALQPKLLRALENCQIRPVGSDRSIETDVRIIAATHHNLRGKVHDGSFREDLYFRLNVVQMQTPRLRDRMEDFDDLFYFFARHHRIRFTFNAIQKLKAHSWPGNIRELRNTVARAKAYFPAQDITEEKIPEIIENVVSQETPAPRHRSVIREIEHDMIVSRLIANHGNQRKTALDLGIPKSTLNDRIKKYGIDLNSLSPARASEQMS